MVIILSRPLSREPNTLPPLFFVPLSSVTAMSNDLDLGGANRSLSALHNHGRHECAPVFTYHVFVVRRSIRLTSDPLGCAACDPRAIIDEL
ncbi:hypothetical protein EYF80_010902 [Liparis tanakae]|uniref:Uncharacterized protein n=1 Tax=Liparis tanakae TaxID=230148 RepID=A0A4Z2IND3_9TELE|nr:hypothetical protein EYF80_010902 [Liparis tanakae]